MTIVDFLKQRIAEDEALARADDGPDQPHGRYCGWRLQEGPGFDDDGCQCRYPARVLAECAAKRAIVERETAGRAWKPGDRQPPQQFISASEPLPEDVAAWRDAHTVPVTDTPTLRLLAVVYADHPAYRQEWKP